MEPVIARKPRRSLWKGSFQPATAADDKMLPLWARKAAGPLRGLIHHGHPNPLNAYHRLGEGASTILQRAKEDGWPLTTKNLAKTIGVQDATLRQSIKLSERATKKLVAELTRQGVAWRAVVMWLGVDGEDASRQVLARLLRGREKSTEIRQFIASRSRKSPAPRRWGDFGRVCDDVRTASEALLAKLQAFAEVQQRLLSDPVEARRSKAQIRSVYPFIDRVGKVLRSARQR